MSINATHTGPAMATLRVCRVWEQSRFTRLSGNLLYQIVRSDDEPDTKPVGRM